MVDLNQNLLVLPIFNSPPVVTISDHNLHVNTWVQIQNWLSYSDADFNAATLYQFWDSGTGAESGYFWTPDNPHQPANTTIQVAAADLANVWVRGGATTGTDTMWVRAFDGRDWSNWDNFTLTTTQTPPVTAIADHNLHVNQWAQITNWLSYSDADGDAATKYQFWDSGTGANSGYFWTPDDTHHAANTVVEVNASDLTNVWVRGGLDTGTESMWVRAFDGLSWGNWDLFALTSTEAPPVTAIADHNLHVNEWAQITNWLSYSDADGDAATKYQFWDSGTGANSGYFWTPDDTHHAANTVVEVNASDLANVWVRGGLDTGTESMWVRAFDGFSWGNWDLFALTTTNTVPLVGASNQGLQTNQWEQVDTFVTFSDADGDAVTKYQFWDSGAGANSGYFWTPANSHNPANTVIEVAASDLHNTWVRGGAATGSESMWARGFDGTGWSNWALFTLTTVS